jgi:hypothetical protein
MKVNEFVRYLVYCTKLIPQFVMMPECQTRKSSLSFVHKPRCHAPRGYEQLAGAFLRQSSEMVQTVLLGSSASSFAAQILFALPVLVSEWFGMELEWFDIAVSELEWSGR